MTENKTRHKVAAIVPAYNEETTIGVVLKTLLKSKELNEIIVVSSGSTDRTSEISRSLGIKVVNSLKKIGKGGAMREGLKMTQADIIVFFDADLVGLTTEHVSQLVRPILENKAEMVVGIRDRLGETPEFILKIDPVLAFGGERAMRRNVFEKIPLKFSQGFAIETALNYYCYVNKIPVIFTKLKGLDMIIKEKKFGFVRGFYERIKMQFEMVKIRILILFNKKNLKNKMHDLSLVDKLRFAGRRFVSLFNNQLLVVSFESTLSCNCDCHHCDLGGPKKEEKLLEPKDYARIVRELKPLVVQISGGESLLRRDIIDIVKASKQFGGLPYTIVVSNGVLLNEKMYLELVEAGLNQLSISLDFPDERHDEFRRHPGLFKHLQETIPNLAKHNFKNIILNSCITSANFKELIPLAKKAMEWGVSISYSAYTPLRTGDMSYTFAKEEDVKALGEAINDLLEFKKRTDCIVNSKTVLLKFLDFLEKGTKTNCQAGLKFVVVMPDGSFVPCSMRRHKFSNVKELREKFSKKNLCDGCCGCYVSIRCYSERSILEEIKEIPEYLKIAHTDLLGLR